MYEKFGEFDSFAELNRTAAGQKAEGDEKALMELAIENGIDKEDVEDYLDGVIEELSTPLTAAFGKLKAEDEDLKTKDIMNDWYNYIVTLVSADDQMAIAVRKRGKSLKECIGVLLKWSFGHQQNIDKDILKAAGVSASKVTIGIPGMGTAHKLIKEYYLGGNAR